MYPLASRRHRITVIYGTRHEAVRVALLITALDESALFTTLVTVAALYTRPGQQRFGISPNSTWSSTSPAIRSRTSPSAGCHLAELTAWMEALVRSSCLCR